MSIEVVTTAVSAIAAAIPLVIRAIASAREAKKEKVRTSTTHGDLYIFLNNYLPTWQGLKTLATNRIFKTSYLWIMLVPLIAKFLSHTETGINIILQQSPLLTLNLSVPFSWNLFYFGSLLFVLANVVYSMKAPKLIKRFNDFNGFMEKENSGVVVINSVEDSLETYEEKDRFIDHLHYHFHYCPDIEKPDSDQRISIRQKMMMNLNRDELANLFALSIEYLEKRKLYSRLIVSSLYFGSMALYGYVAIEQSIFVVKEFMRHHPML